MYVKPLALLYNFVYFKMAAVEDPNLPEVQEEEGILEQFFRNISNLLDEAENTSNLQGKELTALSLESACNFYF